MHNENESEIIQDFKRELSVWQQEIEVEANHSVVQKTLEIPTTAFFFHYDHGTSTAYRKKKEREELPGHYLKLATLERFSEKMRDRAYPIIQRIKKQADSDSLNTSKLRLVRKNILDIWPAYLLGYNLPRFEEKGIFLPQGKTELENLSIAKEIRKASEGIYDYVESAIRKSMGPIFAEHAIPVDHIRSSASQEIFKALDSKVVPPVLDECIIDQEGIHPTSFHDYLRNKGYKLYEEKRVLPEGLRGVVASTGGEKKVTGRVRILKKSDLDSAVLEEGEILVTMATSPDFVSLMKKAVGIITEEGGLLSHAAIVSRELNKPCIVQTKIATKVLNDGDAVEMNLENGEVRRA